MKIFCRTLAVTVASLAVLSCSGAKTGVTPAGVLTTNQRPAMAITVNAPMTLLDGGRLWVSPKTDMLPGAADATFDYGLYAVPGTSPAAAFAYAAIIRLNDRENWEFVPQGPTLPGSFGSRRAASGVDGYSYTVHVSSQGDWAAELLAANGVSVPEAWIAKRWLFSLDRDLRALAEYREPWPADLDVPDSDLVLLREKHAAFLRAFDSRAAAVFSFSAGPGDFDGASPRVSAWNRAPVLPAVSKLAGDVIRRENNWDNYTE